MLIGSTCVESAPFVFCLGQWLKKHGGSTGGIELVLVKEHVQR